MVTLPWQALSHSNILRNRTKYLYNNILNNLEDSVKGHCFLWIDSREEIPSIVRTRAEFGNTQSPCKLFYIYIDLFLDLYIFAKC